jgi:putative transposase
MTFLSKVIPQGGGQGRPDAPENLLRAMELVQETMQAEFDQFVSGVSFQRSDARRGWRNGFKPRTFNTRVGKLVLRIPQDRQGRFSRASSSAMSVTRR